MGILSGLGCLKGFLQGFLGGSWVRFRQGSDMPFFGFRVWGLGYFSQGFISGSCKERAYCLAVRMFDDTCGLRNFDNPKP